MSVSILLINTVNTIISEWFFLTSSVFSDIFTSNRYGSYGTVVRYGKFRYLKKKFLKIKTQLFFGDIGSVFFSNRRPGVKLLRKKCKNLISFFNLNCFKLYPFFKYNRVKLAKVKIPKFDPHCLRNHKTENNGSKLLVSRVYNC